jgi:hypothetical protein
MFNDGMLIGDETKQKELENKERVKPAKAEGGFLCPRHSLLSCPCGVFPDSV